MAHAILGVGREGHVLLRPPLRHDEEGHNGTRHIRGGARHTRDGVCPMRDGSCPMRDGSCHMRDGSCPMRDGSCPIRGSATPPGWRGTGASASAVMSRRPRPSPAV
eukprot:1358494-Prymnesium_polylepis.1